MQKILLTATLILALAACKAPKALQYNTIANVQVQSMDLKHTVAQLDISFYNPNEFAVQLNHVDAVLNINNQPSGKAGMDTLIQLPAMSNSVLPVQIQLDNQVLMAQSVQLLLGGSIPYHIEGFAMAGKKKPRWKIPFSQQGSFSKQMFEKLFR